MMQQSVKTLMKVSKNHYTLDSAIRLSNNRPLGQERHCASPRTQCSTVLEPGSTDPESSALTTY